MKRREFITLVAGAVALPDEARAQQAAAPRRIGFLLVGLSTQSNQAQHFRQGMRDAGYSEGRNVVIEWREAKGDYDRVPELVADLVRSSWTVLSRRRWRCVPRQSPS
jgi:putative tryptophan/tyrosine transport system substrate-binding protein